MDLDLSAEQLATVRSILDRFLPGRTVWVFGSRSTRRAKAYSDLDLALLGGTPVPLADLSALAEAFSESDLPFKVDLVDWATTSDEFRRIIESTKTVLRP